MCGDSFSQENQALCGLSQVCHLSLDVQCQRKWLRAHLRLICPSGNLPFLFSEQRFSSFCLTVRCKQSPNLEIYRQRLQNSKLHIDVSPKNWLNHYGNITSWVIVYTLSYFIPSFTRVCYGYLDLYIFVPKSLAFVFLFSITSFILKYLKVKNYYLLMWENLWFFIFT